MISDILFFGAIGIFCCFLEAALFHKRNRNNLTLTCLKETHIQTYWKFVVTNLFILVPLWFVFAVVHMIMSVF